MASTDASAYPIKNTAWRVTFPILDADGDLVTGATGLDSEISKDAGTFADCTNEATEIATSSGMYYLDLTSTEMNADTVAIIVKSSGKTTPIVVYPITASVAKLGVNLVNIAGSAVSTSTAQLGVNAVQAGGTAWGSGAITAGAFASDAITAAKLAADVTTELQNGLATAANLSTLQTSVDDLPTNAELSTALGTADDAVLAAIAALNNLSAAQVNAEVVDALATDTYAEPGQGAPAATAALSAKINYLYKAWRNKKEQTATLWTLYNDDGTTAGQKSTVSDDGTTATREEVATGA